MRTQSIIPRSEWKRATGRTALKICAYFAALPVGLGGLLGFNVGQSIVLASLTPDSPRPLDFDPVARGEMLGAVAGGVFGLMLLVALFLILRNRKPAFVRVLDERPHDVVWVFRTVVMARGQYGTMDSWMNLGTSDGKLHRMRDSTGNLPERLAAVLPHATHGALRNGESEFAANPESFRRPAPGHPAPVELRNRS